jgi:pyridoxine/pyridoxamine 5'-phosphate oxidase
MHHIFFSLRFRLILLVLFAVIPALGIIFYTGLEQRKIAATQAKKEALSLVHFASRRQKQLVDGLVRKVREVLEKDSSPAV